MFWNKKKTKEKEEEDSFQPKVCMYCTRPFTTYVRKWNHEIDCAEEKQKQLDAAWFTPKENR